MSILRALGCAVVACFATSVAACAVGDERQVYGPLEEGEGDAGDGDGAFHFDPASPAACAAPKKKCDDLCVDVTNDPSNCGACGKKCASGATCVSSSCGGGDSGPSPSPSPSPSPECPPGQAKCGGKCIDVASDATNCGSCGASCPSGWACVKSVCGLTCAAGTIDCGGGVCVSTTSDPANCGACGSACPAGSSCVAGACELVCTGGKTKCGDTCAKLSSDHSHCGECDHACAPLELCLAGICWGL